MVGSTKAGRESAMFVPNKHGQPQNAMLVAAVKGTGFIVGHIGVGGGSLMTPALLRIFGVAPLAVVGTDLWFAAISKIFAMRVHHSHCPIDWQVIKRLWCGSMTAAALTLGWFKPHCLKVD